MNTRSFLLAAGFGLALAFALIGCDGGGLTDKRDGKKYRSVKIGEQVWMAENLNLEIEGSKCFDDKAENCAKYGRLYNWNAAMKACPKGWHLPTNAEWDKLFRNADGDMDSTSPYESETAGKFLKAASGWNDDEGKSGNGEDKFGFAALPGGYGSSGGSFIRAGYLGYWWSSSSSEDDASIAYSRGMYYDYEHARLSYNDKSGLRSVRCLQD